MRCFRFLVLWVFAGGVEIPLLLNVMNDGHYPMAAVWCGHMAAAALTALAVARWDDSAGFFQKWTGWLFLWALLLPGAGWLFGGILAMAGWNAREPGESIA